MSNPIRLIRFPPAGLEVVREARIQAMREGKTLGEWLTEVLPDVVASRAENNGTAPFTFSKGRQREPSKPGV